MCQGSNSSEAVLKLIVTKLTEIKLLHGIQEALFGHAKVCILGHALKVMVKLARNERSAMLMHERKSNV